MTEYLLQYPGLIDVKIFVKSDANNDKLIKQMLLACLESEYIITISWRHSRNNQYQSYSCKINAQNKQQMDALYQYLTNHPSVVMVL